MKRTILCLAILSLIFILCFAGLTVNASDTVTQEEIDALTDRVITLENNIRNTQANLAVHESHIVSILSDISELNEIEKQVDIISANYAHKADILALQDAIDSSNYTINSALNDIKARVADIESKLQMALADNTINELEIANLTQQLSTVTDTVNTFTSTYAKKWMYRHCKMPLTVLKTP